MLTRQTCLNLYIEFEQQKYLVELKLQQGAKTKKDGRAQLANYKDKLGCTE
jgi:hypothetical protein